MVNNINEPLKCCWQCPITTWFVALFTLRVLLKSTKLAINHRRCHQLWQPWWPTKSLIWKENWNKLWFSPLSLLYKISTSIQLSCQLLKLKGRLLFVTNKGIKITFFLVWDDLQWMIKTLENWGMTAFKHLWIEAKNRFPGSCCSAWKISTF